MKLSNRDLKALEGKITQKRMSKIDVLISKKCKEIFSNSKSESSEDLKVFNQEIKSLTTSILSLQNDFKNLSNQPIILWTV